MATKQQQLEMPMEGERYRLMVFPCEYVTPCCDVVSHEHPSWQPAQGRLCTVVSKNETYVCPLCGAENESPEGFVAVKVRGYRSTVQIPWTWLEPACANAPLPPAAQQPPGTEVDRG